MSSLKRKRFRRHGPPQVIGHSAHLGGAQVFTTTPHGRIGLGVGIARLNLIATLAGIRVHQAPKEDASGSITTLAFTSDTTE